MASAANSSTLKSCNKGLPTKYLARLLKVSSEIIGTQGAGGWRSVLNMKGHLIVALCTYKTHYQPPRS